jgi:hypothetical protein
MTRTIPAALADSYLAEGWWTGDTLGDLLARGLAAAPESPFRVHSAVRPFSTSQTCPRACPSSAW